MSPPQSKTCWQLGLLIILSLWAPLVVAIWPKPQLLETGNSIVWYSPEVELRFQDAELYQGHSDAQQPLSHDEEFQCFSRSQRALIQRSFDQLKQDIIEASFVPWKFHPANADFEPDSVASKTDLRHVEVKVAPQAISQSNSTEAYHLEALEDGTVSISAQSIDGVRHAFTTLAQLFYAHSQGGIYSSLLPVTITDWPRFAHRGINIDISRNEISPEDIIRTLDNMKWVKFNRLHVHATDSQSWPLEIPSIPELAAKGAYRADHIWSAETLQEVQEYGQSLGIEVYLEIDMPGHTASVHYSHPELIAGFGAPLINYSASEPPSGQLRLNSTSVQQFLAILFSDLTSRIAPYNRHFHIGGDEFNTNIYGLDSGVNSTDKHILRPLLQSFYDRILPYLAAHDLTPILWQEAILEWNLSLPAASIIQIWRPKASHADSSDLAKILSRGHRALFGAASHWYLDCGTGTFLNPISKASPDSGGSGVDTIVKPPFDNWCAPYKSWRQVYSYDPFSSLSAQQCEDLDLSLVIGGEVHLWAELTDGTTLDNKLWMRAGAAAEVMWNGIAGEKGVTEDVGRRLADLRERFVTRGIAAEVVSMTWCLMNQGACQA